MSKELVFEGKTTEEAINAAARALDMPPEQLNFTILSTGSRGLFGLGGKKAKIRVQPAEPESESQKAHEETAEIRKCPEPETVSPALDQEAREPAGQLTDRSEKTEPQEKAPRPEKDKGKKGPAQKSEQAREEKLSVNRPKGGEAKSYSDSSGRNPKGKEEFKPKKSPAQKTKGPRDKTENHPKKEPRALKPKKTEPPESVLPEDVPRLKWSTFPIPGPLTRVGQGEAVYAGPPDQAMAEAAGLLKEIIDLLGLKAEIRSSRIGQRIILELESLDNYLLIGRKGASLNALELVINRIVRQRNRREQGTPIADEAAPVCSRAAVADLLAATEADKLDSICGDKPEDPIDENPQIVLDAENYRARRHQGILERTAFMGEKVLKTNKPQVMTQLSPPERRLVHLAIESVPGLTTKSHGFGLVRNLTILPKKNKPQSGCQKSGTKPEKTEK
ncbi:MAG: Jag N-terminal domain-containing protein [Deltaproteobacteria bacterium]|jgi:spoIIIJ-associated protein|nr:Jag N-terminal domain-containing protein [Deltaproteobacteria bacterium]